MSLVMLCVAGSVGPAGPAGLAGLAPARADGPTESDPDLQSIGARLLEAPVERYADPRAKMYIVDHLPPGSIIQRRILVVNRTVTRQRIEIYPAAAMIEQARFRFADGRTGNELTSWISLDRDEVDLEPQGEAEVKATIMVPPTASNGERYGVIWASVGSLGPRPPAHVRQVQRVGIRTYLDIGPGGEPPSSFKVGEMTPARSGSGEPSVTIKVTNTGGRALDMTGSIELSDGPAGIRAGPFDVVKGTTLAPGDVGQVLVTLPSELPNGPWKIEVTLKSGLIEETVTGEITFPDPGGVGTPALLFVKLNSPWSIVGLSLAVGLVILIGLVPVVRRSRRRAHPAAR